MSAVEAARAWPMYRAMVGVGLHCGLLIVGVFQLTGPVIARNRAEALERAIFQLLPDARSRATFRWVDGERFLPLEAAGGDSEGGGVAHAGYDGEGALVGFALEGSGMGYQDVIHLLYGYSSAADAIVFIAAGVWRLVSMFMFQGVDAMMMIVSGLLAVFLGVIVIMNWPVGGMEIVGVVVGVELLFTGATRMAVGGAVASGASTIGGVVKTAAAGIEAEVQGAAQDAAEQSAPAADEGTETGNPS